MFYPREGRKKRREKRRRERECKIK